MQVSIITPLFNRLDLTRVYLESLERTLRRWQYEVIFVDDGSTDGTREFLQTLSEPRYRVVLNEQGLGFAANNNFAARLARAPLLCLLNNDTVLLPRWLEPMARLARLLPDVACVGNVQREPVSGLIDHYGFYFREDGVPVHAGKNASFAPRESYLQWSAVTAACCVVRREMFLGLGGFDESYKNGLEDVDFCLRAGLKGFRHFVANRSTIYHHVSASPGRKAHEEANLALFLQRCGAYLSGEGRKRRTVADAQAEGWRYLHKHRAQPWRYNGWRVAQAVEKILSPHPPSRGLELLPQVIFAVQDAVAERRAEGRRQKAEGRETSDGGDTAETDPENGNRSGRPTTEESSNAARGGGEKAAGAFLVVGETALSASRSGVPTLVRCLAGALGRRQAPVRLVGWRTDSQSLRLMPLELSVGLDAEDLRVKTDEPGRSAAGWTDPAMGTLDDPFAGMPALHELPALLLPPPGAWIVLPEVLYGGQTGRLVEYVKRHGWRLAVVLHDLLAVNEPEMFPTALPNEHEQYLQACSRADLVLPVSEFTAQDWRTFTAAKGWPMGRVEVCQPGADTCVQFLTERPPPRDPAAPVRMLCVSAVEPRKNHAALLAAYELAAAARPEVRLELCLVGETRTGFGTDGVIHKAMARHPGRITWYEWVDFGALHRLYLVCDFAVYPSVLEGFGLPVVESLWFKRPCVCANFGAMNALAAGGGCITTDVREPQALADAMLSLVDSPERLANLAGEIDRRVMRTWEMYAGELLGILRGDSPAR